AGKRGELTMLVAATRRWFVRGTTRDRLCASAMSVIVGCGMFVPQEGACSQPGSAARQPISIEDQISMRQPRDVQMPPDGKWVAFVLSTPNLGPNQSTHDICVVAADGKSAARRLTHHTPGEGLGSSFAGPSAVWSRDSDR